MALVVSECDMSEFLATSELIESMAFICSFVKELAVVPAPPRSATRS